MFCIRRAAWGRSARPCRRSLAELRLTRSASTCCSRRSACSPRWPPPARRPPRCSCWRCSRCCAASSASARAGIQHSLELGRAYRGTALLLRDLLEEDDEYTGHHTEDVVELAVKVAEEMGLDEDARRETEMGALLHDIGKIAVPDEIINKPGPLNDEEWAIMKTHTVEGERMLQQVGGLLSSVGRVVRASHERWDGGGYPDGLAGEEIPVRRPHLRRLRRLQRDDHRPLLPQGAAAVGGDRRAARQLAAPSSRPTWSTR